jgi:hypothetical protein
MLREVGFPPPSQPRSRSNPKQKTLLGLRNDHPSFAKTTVYVQYTFRSRNYYFSTKEKIDLAH